MYVYAYNNPVNLVDNNGLWTAVDDDDYQREVRPGKIINNKARPNRTTPPLKKYGIGTVPSTGDIINIVFSTLAGLATGTIASNADKWKAAPDYVKGVLPTISKVKEAISKGLAGGSVILDVANTWTADSENTTAKRFAKTGIQVLVAYASFEIGKISAEIAAEGIATSETGVGVS